MSQVAIKLNLRSLLSILFGALLVFNACTENSDPSLNLPGTLCSPSFSYGYTDKISYLPGDKMRVFMQTTQPVEICRLDIYTVNGTLAFSVSSSLTKQQIIGTDPSVKGYGFTIFSEVEIPNNLKSGVYLIEKQIPFILKTTNPVDLVIVYPSNTANAYSRSGGKSLYDKIDRPSNVSFLRPIELQSQSLYGLKWFATLTNYNIGYIADSDMDDFNTIKNAQIVTIMGHSEYWTRKARKNFDQFVNAGKNAIILSGNTMWWQVRYTETHQMICYKETALDPIDDNLLKSIIWTDPLLDYSIFSSIGADFPHGGYGLQSDAGWDGYKIAEPASPLLEGLNLKKGDILSLPSGEYDGAPILNFTTDGYPVLDKSALGFQQVELIGFDRGSRGGVETIGTFIAFKKNNSSGIVVNAASYDWCSERGIGGPSGEKIKRITLNAIDKLLKHQTVFSN
jgi:hypothetical protein